MKLIKVILKILAVVVITPVVFVLVLMVWYIWGQRGHALYSVENDRYSVEVVKYPSGFGTVDYLRIYSYNKSYIKRELLLSEDGIDSAKVDFIGTNTIQVFLMRKFTSLQTGYYWHTTDSLVISLE